MDVNKVVVIVFVAYIVWKCITAICDAYVVVKYCKEKTNETILNPLPKIRNNRYIVPESSDNTKKVRTGDTPAYHADEIKCNE